MNQPQEPLRDRKVTLFGTTRSVEGDETAHPRTGRSPETPIAPSDCLPAQNAARPNGHVNRDDPIGRLVAVAHDTVAVGLELLK